jgi:nucleotide-binding universal stress UspA family protein
MKVLVAYDGTLQSKEALRYGMEKVRDTGGEVIALHVFNSRLFIDYDAHPEAEESARKESARYLEDAKKLMEQAGNGLRVRIAVEEGDPEEEIIRYAQERHVDVLLCPPRYKTIIKRYKKMLRNEGREVFQNDILDETERLKMAVVSMQ